MKVRATWEIELPDDTEQETLVLAMTELDLAIDNSSISSKDFKFEIVKE